MPIGAKPKGGSVPKAQDETKVYVPDGFKSVGDITLTITARAFKRSINQNI